MKIIFAKGNPEKFLYLKYHHSGFQCTAYTLHTREIDNLGTVYLDAEGFFSLLYVNQLLGGGEYEMGEINSLLTFS